jgi:hypothetical protein
LRYFFLLHVLHQEQFNSLLLTRTQVIARGIEIFDVVKGISLTARTVDGVDTLGFIEGPEVHQILQQRPKSVAVQRQQATLPSASMADRSSVEDRVEDA